AHPTARQPRGRAETRPPHRSRRETPSRRERCARLMSNGLLGLVVSPAFLVPLLAFPLLHGERWQGNVLVQLAHCGARFEERDRNVAISFDLIPQPVAV